MTSRPHDALFRSAFELPEHAAGELRFVLPPELTAAIDWATLTAEPGSFVDDELADRHSDLLFSASIGSERALIYLLLEHQSEADPIMPLRMLVYIVRIWERHIRDHGGAELPAVIPVVISHAAQGWNVATRMHELVRPDPSRSSSLAELVPGFRIIVDDLASTSTSLLRSRALDVFSTIALWLLRERVIPRRCSTGSMPWPKGSMRWSPRRTASPRWLGCCAISTWSCPSGPSTDSMAD